MRNRIIVAAIALLAVSIAALTGHANRASAHDLTCPSYNQVTNVSAISISGTTASVNFVVASGCQNVKLSFVTYTAPAATFNPATADEQVLFQQKTDYFDSGWHTWSITIPSCYYQADLVYGNPIVHLSSNNLYGSLKLAESNGGTQSCGGEGGGADVTLCHATDSQTNPYVRITVDASGAYHGHYTQHMGSIYPGSNGKWGDIIPPFTYDDHSYSLNWTTAGQAIYNAGCVTGGQGGGTVDCDKDTDNSPASECTQPQPQTDCDGDTDNSPTTEVACAGGQGGGTPTTPTTPTTTTTVTTTTGGQGGGEVATTPSGGQGSGEVATTPSGGVNAGEGGGSQSLNPASAIGLLSSLSFVGLGLRKLVSER